MYAFFLGIIFTASCEKDNEIIKTIIGNWKLFKIYSPFVGGDYSVEIKDQWIKITLIQ